MKRPNLTYKATTDPIAQKLIKQYLALRSWRRVADTYDHVSAGTLCRIANGGYEPKSNAIRQQLGYPIYDVVKVCKKCGKAHPTRYCTQSWKDRHYNDLWSMPTLYLLILLHNRETF